MSQERAFVLALALWLAALLLYRHYYVEPRAWVDACAASTPPFPCAPRQALLWAQHWGLWGCFALALGFLSFVGAPLATLAIAAGIAGVVNYNATWGMLGAALGAWAWISPARRP